MLTLVHGNIFNSRMQTIVNTVNCVGVMGKGLALQYKLRYPDMFNDYRRKCTAGVIRPGNPDLYRLNNGVSILNFPTKRHWHDRSHMKDIEDGLNALIANYRNWSITSIAVPPLGCGCGGLNWSQVKKLMIDKLEQLEIPVEIYIPDSDSKLNP